MYSAIKIFILIGLNFYLVHSLESMEVSFWLYTNENIDKYEDMAFDGEKATIDSNTKFDPNRPTKVVAHGLGGGVHMVNFVDSYAKVGVNYNVIAVYWRKTKAKYLENIGKYTAYFLQDLVKNHGLKIEDVHCIGFSYGTHVIGTYKFTNLELKAKYILKKALPKICPFLSRKHTLMANLTLQVLLVCL